MLEESKDIKIGFRYSQARTLFEDDPRWKVSNSAAYASKHHLTHIACQCMPCNFLFGHTAASLSTRLD